MDIESNIVNITKLELVEICYMYGLANGTGGKTCLPVRVTSIGNNFQSHIESALAEMRFRIPKVALEKLEIHNVFCLF